ncbi:MAG TPA: response regulator [Pirellulales bacterium]|jgi:CheY-like chemotaxis protein|nr:response regulator [Pirellulales bacterium]
MRLAETAAGFSLDRATNSPSAQYLLTLIFRMVGAVAPAFCRGARLLCAQAGRSSTIEPMVDRNKPLRVLVIEDYPDTAELLAKWVALAGHSALICRTGVEALNTAPTYRPDVILLDIGLPDMYGWDLARSFRKDPALAQARIIAVTAYSDGGYRRRSEQVGIDVHLGKPVPHEEIARLLAQDA